MKNLLSLVLFCLIIIGCDTNFLNSKSYKHIQTNDKSLEFTFPGSWFKNNEPNPFDLQCFSQFQRMNTSVFVYRKEDLADDQSPLEILDFQINDLKSKRNNFKRSTSRVTKKLPNKKLTTVVYSGDKSGSTNNYSFTLIEFDKDESLIAILLQISFPDEWRKNKDILMKIAESAILKVVE